MSRKVEVVVIAPVGVTVTVKASCRHETLVFSSVAEFERWRHGATHVAAATIASCVRDACALARVSTARIEPAIEWLSRRSTTPTVKELAGAWSSRRSFFRIWKADIAISPHEFLRLVRCLHAEDLLGRGMDEHEAARTSGFGTAALMHRAIRQRKERETNRA